MFNIKALRIAPPPGTTCVDTPDRLFKGRFYKFAKNFNCFYFKRCLKAFTLAEVLVTLGIIGVVSAMTVPSLMQNHQRKTYVTQLHKVYTEVQQASLQYMAHKNAINLREAGLTNSGKMKEFLNGYFKVVNDCGSQIKQPCFAES